LPRSNIAELLAEWPWRQQCITNVFAYVATIFTELASILAEFSCLQAVR
jgi:hypothetical protein